MFSLILVTAYLAVQKILKISFQCNMCFQCYKPKYPIIISKSFTRKGTEPISMATTPLHSKNNHLDFVEWLIVLPCWCCSLLLSVLIYYLFYRQNPLTEHIPEADFFIN